MSQAGSSAVRFNEQLSSEAERVLADVIFTRAPIQRRLLKFLVSRTIAGSGPITQYEIAVDGLGRGEDYYIDSDSYPRVQTSRLRRNLESYYGRNLPGNGFRLALEPGSYSLTLEKASGNTPTEPQAAALDSEAVPERNLRQRLSVGRVGLTALVLIGLISTPNSIGSAPISTAKPAPTKPFTALVLQHEDVAADQQLPTAPVEAASWIAKVQLMKSFVSKPLPPGGNQSQAEYLIMLDFGPDSEGDFLAELSVSNKDGEVMYSKGFVYDHTASEAFSAELKAALIYVTSPTGLIARAERPQRDGFAGSDYACFLSIEHQRLNGLVPRDLIDRCIRSYPSSSYKPFWQAQRSITHYQDALAAGRPIAKTGPAWSDLNEALKTDRYNPYANFAAAKIEMAMGDCEHAMSYITRVLEHGESDPALVAAGEINTASCVGEPTQKASLSARIEGLAKANPNPDPLLRLYLVIGFLAANDLENAKMTARRAANKGPGGRVEKTSALLRQAIEDRAFAIVRREEVADALSPYVWDDRVKNDIVAGLIE